MTHNTREVEEMVETLLEELSYGGRKNYLDDTMGMDTARGIIRTTLHHQLQKARAEILEEMLQSTIVAPDLFTLKKWIREEQKKYHPELDQDK